MNCPVCARSLAPTLSICPSCGAMMNDTVREELQTKITQGRPIRREVETPEPPKAAPPVASAAAVAAAPAPRMAVTTDLVAPKTSPTLVGFQTPKTSVPEWRLQLQNAVQQRRRTAPAAENGVATYAVSGATALKAEPVQRPAVQLEIDNPTVANAMRRIEQSRQAYFEPKAKAAKPVVRRPAEPVRPFGVVSPSPSAAAAAAPAKAAPVSKPRLVPAPPTPVLLEKRDTNKLPPIEDAVGQKSEAEEKTLVAPTPVISEFSQIKRIEIKADPVVADEIADEEVYDEIEDLAPVSMRFGAGLFDLIVVLFVSFLALSPLAFSRSDWFATTSLLVAAGTTMLVMFIYMTVCLGFFGKTMGMRLFSLELVDAVENEYPTLKQAAVNTSVFIFSLGLGGAGFLTIFFNEERRAVHDLLSGTILVREF